MPRTVNGTGHCARLDRLRDGLLVFFVCIILFCVAAAVYFLTHLLVPAAPVVMLASGITIPADMPPLKRVGRSTVRGRRAYKRARAELAMLQREAQPKQ